MIEGTFFTAGSNVAKVIRHSALPFGGLQVIACGDFFQLPPVSDRDPTTNQPLRPPFAFQSQAWLEALPHTAFFTQVFRQKDERE